MGIDPVKAAQYVQKLKDAGFTQWVTEEDRQVDAYVDVNGNISILHTYLAAKGAPSYNDLVGGEIIENGYYIEIRYSEADEYYAEETSTLSSKAKAKIFLDWENPLVYK